MGGLSALADGQTSPHHRRSASRSSLDPGAVNGPGEQREAGQCNELCGSLAPSSITVSQAQHRSEVSFARRAVPRWNSTSATRDKIGGLEIGQQSLRLLGVGKVTRADKPPMPPVV